MSLHDSYLFKRHKCTFIPLRQRNLIVKLVEEESISMAYSDYRFSLTFTKFEISMREPS